MALLDEAVESKKLDTRMVERNISRGVISIEQHQKSVESLPDDAELGEWVSLDSLEEEKGATQSIVNGSGAQAH